MTDDRPDWEPIPPTEAIERLAAPGLLTERQAEILLMRDVEAVPRHIAVEHLGIQPSTFDNQLRTAREKVESAEETLDKLERIRQRPIPEECAECGDALYGEWSTNDAGEAICLSCAGLTD